MRVQKLLLIIITGALTAILLFSGAITYFMSSEESGPITAIFFLGVTGAFSVYFHMKTKELYPFADFDEPLEELSKKYWALHISFGLVLLILGITMTFLWFKRSSDLSILGISIFLLLLGLWSLIDTYILNKFIVSYKERRERQEEINDIGDNSAV
ncbi:hypothetical protein IMCC3317_21230 [Kordia antarctica]|uniref:Uncharacterized protein n=1 Tax=Kordia antarctica TaxID=1218801 RepID=A0A7L4ZJ64_9FLAO|nr:hypothetical protein [Kordia antarctica]QHI36753.1 hypothetical protein IMCC3317_21230 [Kordia antarctica]